MQLSHRVRQLKPSTTLAVTARVRELNASGEDIIGFGAGQPDFDTPQHIKQAAIDALLAGQTKYMPTPGVPEAREAIADKLRRENNIDCTMKDVIITVGAKQAMYMALQGLVDPGQEVILPTPAWVSYFPMIELAGGRVVEVPGALDNDFKITPKQLEEAITERTAAVIVNSPSNPCGTMYTEAELRALAEVLTRHPHVSIITDEIYEKVVYADTPHVSMGAMREVADRVVTINGLSKAFAMTGWRIGYLCAPGDNGRLAAALPNLQDQITSNITSFCYAAIIEAMVNGAESVETMRQAFSRRAALMYDAVTAMPGLRCPQPTGAYYLFPDISTHIGKRTPGGRTIDSALSFAEALLEEAKVAVVPGEDFGRCAATHVRLSFACADDQIREGCRRISAWLYELG